MRALTQPMIEAIRFGANSPDVRLEILDVTPHFGQIFGGGEAGRTMSIIAHDGALVQAYHTGLTGVRVRRVVEPRVPSWGPWQSLAIGARADAGVAVALLADRIRVLWQAGPASTQGEIVCADSFDHGETWGKATALFNPHVSLLALAADGAGDLLFVAYETRGGARLATWSLDGTWRGVDWPFGDVHGVSGFSVLHQSAGTYMVPLAIQETASTGTRLDVYSYTMAGWNKTATVVPADISAGVAIAEPRLTFYDGLFHIAFAVADDGHVSGLALAHTAVTHSRDGIHWTDPLEDAGTYSYGATLLKHTAGYVLAAPDSAALAPLYSETLGQYHDLSSDISRLEVIRKDGEAQHVVATVQNGRFYGREAPLLPQALLRLSLGYKGAGTILAGLFRLDDWSIVQSADEDEIVLRGSDALALLDRQSRTTLLYKDRTVGWLAREVLTRAGVLNISIPEKEQFAYTVPRFVIPSGTLWRGAFQRLSRLYGFDAMMRVTESGSELCELYEKNSADALAWTYSEGIEQSVCSHSADRANHVLVFGTPTTDTMNGETVVGEAWDWDDLLKSGRETYIHTVEPLITTRQGAALRAASELAFERRQGTGASLSVPFHPGLEPADIIEIQTGSASQRLRVATLHGIYAPLSGVYDMVMTCEGV